MRRFTYVHERPDWPNLHWDQSALADLLASVRHRQGRLIGQMEHLGFTLQQEAVLQTLTNDVLKSSAIEGEKLDAEQVRSSVARHLGLEIGGLKLADRHVEGVVEMMLDATRHYQRPLTTERLFAWHAAMFPTARSGMRPIKTGAWRDDSTGPMQVVSGPIGRERIHYEAPAAQRLNAEMRKFLRWFNTADSQDWVVKAALAHLWFVTIHPFDDGNGRIARAIADMALARSDQSSQRFYSMSSRIQQKRADYYAILERTQKGTTDISAWMRWFLETMGEAIAAAERALQAVLRKSEFCKSVAAMPLNQRQRSMLNRLLEGFEGKLTTSKWAKLTKTSQDTAARDISKLIELGLLQKDEAGGRSTSYSLRLP